MDRPISHPDGPYDLLIANATLVDGTGAPRRPASVAVRDNTIVAVSDDLQSHGAGRVIDGSGLLLAPGFIDMHTHSDWMLLVDPTADSAVRQGVTTQVVGNCGTSPVPGTETSAERQRTWFADRGVGVDFRTMREYLEALTGRGVGTNVVALVGHGAIRQAAMGHAMRAPDAAELAAIRRNVADAMDAGAIGMSFGGAYPPSCYAATEELIEASKEVGLAGGIYASHIRNEGARLLESIEESIRIGRESGASVQISHLKAGGPTVWGRVKPALELIEAANAEGGSITVDQYPYTFSSTWLTVTMPAWAQEGGRDGLVARLRDTTERERIRAEMRATHPPRSGPTYVSGEILIASAGGDASLDGKTIVEIAAERGVDPRDAIIDIVITSHGLATVILFGMSEDDVRYVMRHPLMTVGSDSASMKIGGKSAEGKPHARTYGTFARILGQYVRDEGVLTLEEAVAKMTGRPAAKLGLADRGTVEVGKKADLVLFSASRIREAATFQDPHRYAEGIETVILNGRVVVDGGEHTGTLAGRVLRHA